VNYLNGCNVQNARGGLYFFDLVVAFNPNAVLKTAIANVNVGTTQMTATYRLTATSNAGYTLPSFTATLNYVGYAVLNSQTAGRYIGMITQTQAITNAGLNSGSTVTMTTNVNLDLVVQQTPRLTVLGLTPFYRPMMMVSVQVKTNNVRNISYDYSNAVNLNNLVITTVTSAFTQIEFVFMVVLVPRAGNPSLSVRAY
jgi:hypothetical protein